jgi:ribonuclease BN (tRNA processing enzyme)
MRLTIIGCGDAFGSGGRFNTCFRIEAAGRTILVDFGATSMVALKARNLDPNEIDVVVLSHLHGDHFGGLPFLLLDAQFLGRRSRPLLIAGPPGTRQRLDAALEVFFPHSSTMTWQFAWEVIEIEPRRRQQILELTIDTVEVDHPSGAPSTALRLTDGQRVLAYSGDTQWTDALLEIARGSDLFIFECYDYDKPIQFHMSWSRLSSQLDAFGARRLMITHMNPAMLARVDEAAAAGVLVAADGLTLEI